METAKTLVASFFLLLWMSFPSLAYQKQGNQSQLHSPHVLANTDFFSRCAWLRLFLCFFESDHLNSTDKQTNPHLTKVKIDAQSFNDLGINIQLVRQQILDSTLKTAGQVEIQATQHTKVTATHGGVVTALLVNLGDTVKQGQPLAMIAPSQPVKSPDESLDSLAQAQTELLNAQLNLQQAQENYQLQQSLAMTEPLSTPVEGLTNQAQNSGEQAKGDYQRTLLNPQVQAAKKEVEQAQADVKAAQTRLKLFEIDTNKQANHQEGLKPIFAPISGTVEALNIGYGQSIQPLDNVVNIANYHQILVQTTINQEDRYRVNLGQQVRVNLSSFPYQTVKGKISYIAPVSQTMPVIPILISITDANEQIKSGMTVTVEIGDQNQSITLLTVPTIAVVEAYDKKWIYKKTSITTYQPIEVRLGQTFGNWIAVEGDLIAGDPIVAQGARMLYFHSLAQQTSQTPDWLLSLFILIGATGALGFGVIIFTRSIGYSS